MPIHRVFDRFTVNIGTKDIDSEIEVDYEGGEVAAGETLVLQISYLPGKPVSEFFDIEWHLNPAHIFQHNPPVPLTTFDPEVPIPDPDNLNPPIGPEERRKGTLTIVFPTAAALLESITEEAKAAGTSLQVFFNAIVTIIQNTAPELSLIHI